MAQKLKHLTTLDHIKHRLNISKRRRKQLTLNYLVGLEYEYKKQVLDLKTKETERFNRYFDEDTKTLQKRIDGVHEDTEKKVRLIEKYETKAYWQRRRYKTMHKDSSNLAELLITYDAEQLELKEAFLKRLNSKYPEVPYDQEKQDQFKRLYEIEVEKKQNNLKKLDLKLEKLNVKTVKLIEKNSLKQEKIKLQSSLLNEKIKVYNEKSLLDDELTLDEVNQKLESSNLSVSKKNKLTNLKEQIENKLHIQKHEDIHLSVSNLKMYFGGIKAVNDLSFEVKKGEIFGLIGPNGAGKTTVFNCITQFYKPTGGSIHFRNKENDIVDLSKLQTHDMINEGIARSFQNVELIWELTVLDNLLVSAHSLLLTDYLEHMVHTNKMKREENVLRTKGYNILKELGIEDYAFRSPYGLPYGVLKKIELARTLMTDPSLIILDEPAAGLNDAETIDLAQVIKNINENHGITIFLVEHDMGLVMSICERVCAISFGKKLALDTPKGIQNNVDVRVAYLGEADDE